MNEREESVIVAALVTRLGGNVRLTLHELAALRSGRITVLHVPEDGGVEIRVETPPPAPVDADFRVLEDRRA